MATIIDCHCMGTAIADAYRRENRDLNTEPVYRYATGTLNVKYLKPNPYDYDLGGPDISLDSPESYIESLKALLKGEKNELFNIAVWNGAFYLWHCGAAKDLKAGIAMAEKFILDGKLQATLMQLQASLN